jgi:hypothetical protein
MHNKEKAKNTTRREVVKRNAIDCNNMGVCQSRSGRGSRFHVRSDALAAAKDRTHPLAQSIKKSTSSGGKHSCTSFAYDLALVSPSEKTDATDTLSPTSMDSPPVSDILLVLPNTKENNFDFDFVVDDDDENDTFVSNDNNEFGDFRPHTIVGGTFPEPGRRENRKGRKYTRVNDEDNNDSNEHHFAEEFIGHDPMIENEFDDGLSLSGPMVKTLVDTNYCDTENNHSRSPSIPPNTNQILTEKSIQSTIQSNKEEADDMDFSSDTKSDNLFPNPRSYQLKSTPDPPPLLAPPKDVTLVTCPSNTETAIKPSIMASFNKIETQVKLAHKEEKHRRQEEKIQDRRRDIKGYKELWGEFNKIKERVIKQRETDTEYSSPNKGEKIIPLNDLTTWYVDFSPLNSMHHFDNKVAADDLQTADNEDQKNQTSLPLLIESTKTSGTHSAGSNASPVPTHSAIRESIAPLQNDHDGDTSENGRNIDNVLPSATMDLNSENRSTVSDLDNGSNSSMTSDTGKAFDNDDYGVLHRYSRKSMESTVPSHTDDFDAQPGNMGLHNQDANTLLFAKKSRNEHSATPLSFSTYLAKNCLPSVFIDNAETGQIRWRESPKKDTEVEEARKIDFSHYENVSMKKEAGVSGTAFSQKAAVAKQNMEHFDEVNKENEYRTDQLQLIRKGGPQINDLLAQLQNNGLGEQKV